MSAYPYNYLCRLRTAIVPTLAAEWDVSTLSCGGTRFIARRDFSYVMDCESKVCCLTGGAFKLTLRLHTYIPAQMCQYTEFTGHQLEPKLFAVQKQPCHVIEELTSRISARVM